MLGDIIILHKCTKNNDHMLYCSWDIMRGRCNSYFSFWDILCPFTQQPKKSKLIKCYFFPEIWHVMDVIVIFQFELFLPFYLPLTAQKIKIKKTPHRYINILHICTKNYDQMMYSFWDMVHDGRTEGRIEKVTYRGGCAKNVSST